ncbi:glycosyltransferase [Viridibacterium curvum]
MRIFYSTTDVYPAYRVDLRELFGEALAARGVATKWLMAGSDASEGTRHEYCGQPVRLPPRLGAGWPARTLLNRLLFIAFDMLLVWRNFRCSQIQIVQCRDKFFASSLAAVLTRLMGKPFVYWCSYPFPEHHIEVGLSRGGIKGRLQYLKGRLEQALLYRFIIPRATHSFVQTEQMARDIAAYGVPMARMTAVPMGVPERLLGWASKASVKIVAGRIVYVGTLGAVRRLEMLIEAFARLRADMPAARLVVVGEGDYPHERVALEALADRLGVADAVTFTGFLPIEEAWAYAASAAVCVSPIHPSRVLLAGSPTKLFEYMALGRPVVCNSHPDQSSVIAESGAGLCVEWDAGAFAEAMRWMLANPAEAEAMGARGPAWVAANRTYPILAEIVLRKYQEILGVSR